jgi:hypothetical protein
MSIIRCRRQTRRLTERGENFPTLALISVKPSVSKSMPVSHNQVKIANRCKLDPFQ